MPPKKAVAAKPQVLKFAPNNVFNVQIVGANLNPNLNPIIANYVQQFRPILRAEHHFIRTICDLTKEQREQVAREEEKSLQEVATKLAEMQQNGRPAQVLGDANTDPRAMLQKRIASVAKAHLTPAQLARYESEVEKRQSYRKHVAVSNMVARLDQDLTLSVEQRDKISETLLSQWKESWCLSPEFFMYYNNQLIQNLPAHYVVPLLTPEQKTVWSGLQRNQVFFPVGFFVGNTIDNTRLNEGDLNEPKPAANPPVMKMRIR